MLRDGMEFLLQMSKGRDNKEITITEVGEGEPAEGFGSKLGDGRVKLNQTPAALNEEMLPGRVVETDALRDEIDPQSVHENRSRAERLADEAKDAEITTDPLEWASAPDQYDYPGVDTGPRFRDTFGDGFDEFGEQFNDFDRF